MTINQRASLVHAAGKLLDAEALLRQLADTETIMHHTHDQIVYAGAYTHTAIRHCAIALDQSYPRDANLPPVVAGTIAPEKKP